MKKIFVILGICLALIGCREVKSAMADTLSISKQLQKLPGLKQGIAFSLIENEVNYLSTIELANYKGFTAEVGYSSKDKIVGVVSYQILKLKDLGVTLPILNLIEFNLGIYGGYGRIGISSEQNEADYGLSATLINVKF